MLAPQKQAQGGRVLQQPGLTTEQWGGDRRLTLGARGDLTAAGLLHATLLLSPNSRNRGCGVDSASCFHWVSRCRARPPLRRSPALACPVLRPVPVRPLAAHARPPARPPRRTPGLVVPLLRPHHGGARAARRVLGACRGPLGCPRYSGCSHLPAPRAPWRRPIPASHSAAVRPAPRPDAVLGCRAPPPVRPARTVLGTEARVGARPEEGRASPAERAEVTCVQRPGARESGRREGTRSPRTRCGTSAGKSGESLAGVSKSSGCHPCLPRGQILGVTGSVCQSHVGHCKSCEDGTPGICAQSAASPLPLPGPGIFVLFCLEAALAPMGRLQFIASFP